MFLCVGLRSNSHSSDAAAAIVLVFISVPILSRDLTDSMGGRNKIPRRNKVKAQKMDHMLYFFALLQNILLFATKKAPTILFINNF